MLETFAIDTFAGLVGDRFQLRLGPAEAIELSLAEAAQTGEPPNPGGRAPFALVFRGPPAPILPQRIYGLEHAGLGAFELFLVPLEPDAAGARYEAVFT